MNRLGPTVLASRWLRDLSTITGFARCPPQVSCTLLFKVPQKKKSGPGFRLLRVSLRSLSSQKEKMTALDRRIGERRNLDVALVMFWSDFTDFPSQREALLGD
jgi:hypothetical protein